MKTIALLLSLATTSFAAAPLSPYKTGARWTYSAHVTYEIEGHQKKEKDLTWTMEVKGPAKSAAGEAWQVVGHPRDLSFYEEGKKPSTYYVILKGDEQHTTESLEAPLTFDTLEFKPPYTAGAAYGDPEQMQNTPGRYCWVIGEAKPDLAGVKGAPAPTGAAFKATMQTSPDTTIQTIVPGVGLVSFEYVHHGTPGDVTAKLVEFTPGK